MLRRMKRGKMKDNYNKIGRIACMRCLCELCHRLQKEIIAKAKRDVNEAIEYGANYDGFQCGACENIVYICRE